MFGMSTFIGELDGLDLEAQFLLVISIGFRAPLERHCAVEKTCLLGEQVRVFFCFVLKWSGVGLVSLRVNCTLVGPASSSPWAPPLWSSAVLVARA